MIIRRIFILIFGLALFLSAASFQAQAGDYERFLETLTEINRIDPLQAPSYERDDDILKRHILDRKNRVVGEVQDVILTPEGSISSLFVKFDRLRLNTSVYLNYRDMRIRPVSNGYALSFDDEQIENMYPVFLANIETAAGEEGETVSARSLVGASVKSSDGRKVGKVKHVMFGSRGGQAEVLYIAMIYGILRGKSIAVPYDAVKFDSNGKKPKLTVSEEQADAMIDFAKND